MVPNKIPGARLLTAGGMSALLAACSLMHGAQRPSSPAPPETAPPAATAASSGGSETATQAAIAAHGTSSAAATPAAEGPEASASPVVRASAPVTYTVRRGDTLWGIAAKFLRNPWDWPEVWYLNPRIHNPHLIYPGDVLALAYGKNGRPQIRVVQESPLRREAALRLEPRLRSTPITAAIPTIPYSAIAAFLARPVVLTSGEVQRAPHVIAFRNKHQMVGGGSVAYVSSLGHDPHARYAVIHVGEKLREPGHWGFGHAYGYLGTYTATAVVSQPGDPATVALSDSTRETSAGDRLIAIDAQNPLTMEPRAPSSRVHGKIIWVVGGTGGVDLAGQYDIVVIDRGARAGLAPGDVLAVDNSGGTVHDTHGSFAWLFRSFGTAGKSFAPRVKLPNVRAGTLLVFKTSRQLAFALVVAATNTISVGDVVHNP